MRRPLPSVTQLLGWTSTFHVSSLGLILVIKLGWMSKFGTFSIVFVPSEIGDYPLKVIKSTLNDAFPVQQ